ncbi:MAG: hypothetical protein CMN72_07920 [Sphingomonas sp.]|nr:hypothetical protein [Sphingomonas sp.]
MGAHAAILPPQRLSFTVAPLSLNRVDAIRYMGIADKLFSELERSGAITGRPSGRNGATIYSRAQLENVHARMFTNGATDIDDEFEGIDG